MGTIKGEKVIVSKKRLVREREQLISPSVFAAIRSEIKEAENNEVIDLRYTKFITINMSCVISAQ